MAASLEAAISFRKVLRRNVFLILVEKAHSSMRRFGRRMHNYRKRNSVQTCTNLYFLYSL